MCNCLLSNFAEWFSGPSPRGHCQPQCRPASRAVQCSRAELCSRKILQIVMVSLLQCDGYVGITRRCQQALVARLATTGTLIRLAMAVGDCSQSMIRLTTAIGASRLPQSLQALPSFPNVSPPAGGASPAVLINCQSRPWQHFLRQDTAMPHKHTASRRQAIASTPSCPSSHTSSDRCPHPVSVLGRD